MLTTTFQEWLQEFDYQVGQKHGRERVLLLLDNCSSHKTENLTLSHAFDQLDNQIPEATLEKWLQEFDYQVGQKHGRERVLLLLDNCSSHKTENLTLSYVDVYFLPPNTTSKLQPMDAGIIMAFKKHYRHYHIR